MMMSELRAKIYGISMADMASITTLHVTHSLDEARHLADAIYRIDGGRVSPIETRELA